MAEMFGSALGQQAATADARQGVAALQDLQQMDTLAAHAGYYRAQTKKAEHELGQDQAIGEMMRRAAGGGGDFVGPPVPPQLAQAAGTASTSEQIAKTFDQTAQEAARSGMVGKAEELAKKAAELRLSAARTGSAVAQGRLRQLNGARREVEMVNSLLTNEDGTSAVNSEEDWQRVNAIYSLQTGQKSPYAGLPYDPDLVKRLISSTMTQKEKLDLEIKDFEAQSRDAGRKAREKYYSVTEDLARARLQLARSREARLAREGTNGSSKPLGAATGAEVRTASSIIAQDVPDMPTSDRRLLADTLASEAKALLRSNPAIPSFQQAARQVYQDMLERGELKKEVENPWAAKLPGVDPKYKLSLVKKGFSPQTATPIADAGGKPTVGRYYTAPDGRVGKWNGKGFELVVNPRDSGRGNPGDGGGGSDDDDDEED